MSTRSSYEQLMHVVCVTYGYCGSVKDGAPTHVDDFIPSSGQVSADQFVEWVFLADGVNPDSARKEHRQFLRVAFVEHMGADVVDAARLQWDAVDENQTP